MGLRILGKHLLRLVATVLAAGLFGSVVVVTAPAFGVTEAELDPRLSRSTNDAIRADGQNRGVFPASYFGYIGGLLRGDFGMSGSLNRPVSELLRERLPVSLRNLGVGAGLGTGFGLACALIAIRFRSPVIRAVPSAVSAAFLAMPSAALALVFLVVGWPGSWALAALVFPRVFRYSFAALARWADAPHVLGARARGIAPWRLLMAHTISPAGPQLLAVIGMAISVAFPALVPIEAVCDSPGVGQLAFRAALARDLPVLVSLTMVAAAVVSIGNAAADLSAEGFRRPA